MTSFGSAFPAPSTCHKARPVHNLTRFAVGCRYTFVIAAIVVAITMQIDGLTDGPFHALCLLLSLATTNNIVLMYILSFFVDDPVMMQVRCPLALPLFCNAFHVAAGCLLL